MVRKMVFNDKVEISQAEKRHRDKRHRELNKVPCIALDELDSIKRRSHLWNERVKDIDDKKNKKLLND